MICSRTNEASEIPIVGGGNSISLINLSVISNNNATGQPYQGGQQDPPQDNQGQQKEATCDSLNFVLQLCDASLLVANISQLRAVLDSGSANEYYLQLLVIIIISIVSHILFGMLMILRWKIKQETKPRQTLTQIKMSLCAISSQTKETLYDNYATYHC
ncbi:uncharacterized protein LOC111132702 [Crassostrea virginica]